MRSKQIPKKHTLGILLLLSLMACKQSDPPILPITKTISNPSTANTIIFSGITWDVKFDNTNKMGPGPNYFSSSSKNVFVDSLGYLHLKIIQEGGTWKCAEVISQNFYGYGTYVFTIMSNVADIDPNVVCGLFTWDNTTFREEANSEIDIEFAKWGDKTDTLTLTQSAQPVWFSNPIPYYERTNHPPIPVSKLRTPSTHAFTWTDSLVTWRSYEGVTYPGTNLLSSWRFDKFKQARSKIEGGNQSRAIVIPKPGPDTHARINLWLLNGLGLSNQKEFELIVKEFRFIP
jgi:hypothetical protein